MQCTHCGFENETGVKFCGNCGSAIAMSSSIPLTGTPTSIGLTCYNCGAANPEDSVFCEKCGTKLLVQPAAAISQPISTSGQAVKQKTSGAWWLLPIFLFWLGGLIGWLAVKNRDRRKALILLLTGIIWTPVSWILLIQIVRQLIKFKIPF
jgi:hypothetical protein